MSSSTRWALMAPSPASMRWKYFSISRVMGPSAVRQQAPDFRMEEMRTCLTCSPRASFTASSTSLPASAFSSAAFFSSSV